MLVLLQNNSDVVQRHTLQGSWYVDVSLASYLFVCFKNMVPGLHFSTVYFEYTKKPVMVILVLYNLFSAEPRISKHVGRIYTFLLQKKMP